MITKILFFLLIQIALFSVFSQSESYQSEKLEKLWEASGLNVPESVLPVPEQDMLYVSNIGVNNPTEKEGKGFISIVSMEGKIKNMRWSENLNSPKGMAIYGDRLYVSEVDRIGEIDVNSGKKLNEYRVEGAVFLNDIAVTSDGILYITDSRTGAIHILQEGQVGVYIKSNDFPNPNGIVFNKEKLLLGTGEKIVLIDPTTKKVKDYMLNTGGVDGLAVVEKDVLLFSDWPGKVYLMKKGEEKQLLLDTSMSETKKTADFGFIAEKKFIYIPTFFANSIVCYKLKQD